MGFKLDAMMGKYKDFARGYLFYAEITAPYGIEGDHPYLVNSSQLPTQTIEPIEANWQGNVYKVGGVNTFETFDLTFKCDEEQILRHDFLRWMQKIHDPVSNLHGTPGTSGGYFGKVRLTQLDGRGEPIQTIQLEGAWPSAVGEVTLDYGEKSISTFTVTFTYQYHIVDAIHDSTTAAVPVNLPD